LSGRKKKKPGAIGPGLSLSIQDVDLERNGLYRADRNAGSAINAFALVNFGLAVHHGNCLYRTGSYTAFATNTRILIDLCSHYIDLLKNGF